MSFLDRIKECDNSAGLESYLPFHAGDVRVGWVHRDFVPRLRPFDDVFVVGERMVTLAPGLDDYAARTRAVEPALRALDKDCHFAGWRDEPYPVGTGFHHTPLFEMERTAVPRFGVPAYGVHIHGYVRDGADISLWIGRRADDKPTYPGKLDQMVAGGQPVGIGLMDNLIKEAGEEAGVSPGLAATAKPVGAISYRHESEDGLKPDVMFIYDLELPRDFVPRNTDGEMSGFSLLPAAEVMEITAETRDFKYNCAVANIDFFLRHGLLTPDDPDYVDIARGLHR
jgi:8-oxo-dGTP pyrophosphatase MutT (NUDIX family)